MIKKCPVCDDAIIKRIFYFENIPVINLHYFDNLEDALSAPNATVDFVQCQSCGFVFNRSYHQLDYKIDYDANRSNSAYFKKYLNDIYSTILKYVDDSRIIIEIGAGDCEFAKCFDLSDVVYHAFDTSWSVSSVHGNLYKYNNIYKESYQFKPDLLILRHVLEHQSDVKKFLEGILFDNPRFVYIEIPCFEYVRKNNYHYFSYEHCSYFDIDSIKYLMSLYSYKIIMHDYVFAGENIIAVFEKCTCLELKKKIKKDEAGLMVEFDDWRKKVQSKIGKNTILWGAGGKGVMITNMLKLDKEMPVVDLNPNLHDKYIPVSGNKIISVDSINDYKPDYVLAMNHLYIPEIRNILDDAGIRCNVEGI